MTMTSEMKKVLARLRRENRITAEPEKYNGGACYTVYVTRRGVEYIADIWDDGEITYSEKV